MNVSGNAAVDSSTTQYAWDYWNPSTFGPDSEAYATIVNPGTDVIRIGARITGGGTSSYNGYYVAINGSGVWTIIRVTAGTPTTLVTGPTQALASGDKIAIQIVGSVITALHYTSANGWQVVASYDTSGDATKYTGSGNIALEFRNSTIDDFGGGTI
jgi:hypothetical protein